MAEQPRQFSIRQLLVWTVVIAIFLQISILVPCIIPFLIPVLVHVAIARRQASQPRTPSRRLRSQASFLSVTLNAIMMPVVLVLFSYSANLPTGQWSNHRNIPTWPPTFEEISIMVAAGGLLGALLSVPLSILIIDARNSAPHARKDEPPTN